MSWGESSLFCSWLEPPTVGKSFFWRPQPYFVCVGGVASVGIGILEKSAPVALVVR